MKFCKEEIKIVDEVIEVMEWDMKHDSDGHIHLYKDFFPIIINGKELIMVEEEMDTFNRETLLTFRPVTNGKHVSLLMDFMYENEEDFLESIMSGKNENNEYFCRLIDYDGDIVKEVKSITETSAKFKMFYEYYLESNCDKEILKIKRHEDKIKEKRNQLREQQKSTKNKKKFRK